MPKVGPIDLVGWVRLRGGINDSGDALSRGGDLKAMGLSNAPRRGLDFAGQEARMGPVIRVGGMTLDDAAEAAWEAGYFPELSERPSINEFLQALDDTNRGGANRRFLPEDGTELDEYYGRQAARYDLEQEQDAAGGVEAGGEQGGGGGAGGLAELGRVEGLCHGVQVDHAVERVVGVLGRGPLPYRAQIVAEMHLARRFDP